MNEIVENINEDIVEQTSKLSVWLKSLITTDNIINIIEFAAVILIYFIIYSIIRHGIKKIQFKRLTEGGKKTALRLLKYCFYFAIVVYILGLFGIKLGAIWGAAGIAGIAIGFAAQTSVSNLISGLFIISERSIKIGDTIIIDGVTGIIDTISLLSVRIHTFDNQMVRVPNSSIINSTLINNTYHDKRRLTIEVSVAYEADLQSALETIIKAPSLCPSVLSEPAPAAWIDSFGESGINIVLAVWFKNEDFLAAKNQTFIAIKKVLDDAKIEIPFKQIVVRNN